MGYAGENTQKKLFKLLLARHGQRSLTPDDLEALFFGVLPPEKAANPNEITAGSDHSLPKEMPPADATSPTVVEEFQPGADLQEDGGLPLEGEFPQLEHCGDIELPDEKMHRENKESRVDFE